MSHMKGSSMSEGVTAAMESLKEQGTVMSAALRMLHRCVWRETAGTSSVQATRMVSSIESCSPLWRKRWKAEEESLRKIVHVGCWGPN